MSLGDEWTSTTPGGAAKLNLVTITYGTGAYLATLDLARHKILICTATGSGFTINHIYLCSADGTSTIDISVGAPHSHTDATDGGPLQDIYNYNPHIIDLLLTKTQDLKKAQWIETVTSTGTIEDFTDGTTGERAIRLRPNATSGSGSTIQYPHLKLDFAKSSTFVTKLQIETASSLALHSGVNCDDVTAADSNTIKYNAEVCTTTNNNWFLRSANGTTNSTSDTGTAISTSRVGIQISHYPELGTPEIDISINAATKFQKTTHVPTTGSSADNNVVKHSIKNSTAADRPLKMYGCRVVYQVSSPWGFGTT